MSCKKENDNSLRRNKYQNISINNERKNNYSVSPTSSKYKKIGNYLILKTIGSGTFSTVKLGLHLPTQQKVAIKILDKSRIKDDSDIRRISREIHILSKLYHPNIAQLYETIWSEKHIYIIMEYVDGNHLFNYINSLRKLPELKASKLFVQLISCLEYIHILGIVHRDIKPENILLNKNKSQIKLVDFGLSNSYKYGTLLKTACGSPCYAPPEMISGKDYQPLYSDLWSCGVVLYCMLVGKLPFDDEDIKILYKHIKSANFFMPNFLSNSAQDLLKKILNCNPNKRIRIEDIKKHPFYLMGEKDINNNRGILVGLEEIPVNETIVRKMKRLYFKDSKKIEENFIINNIKNNSHNDITVIYYLLIKKLEGIKDNIRSDTKIKIFNAENNIRNININYINNSEFKNKAILNKSKIKKKIREKNNNNIQEESENISENNNNIEEDSKRGKGNILNINNIRKLIFNSNDISLKSKYNKERFNVVVINNILTETPQNKTINAKSKNINYTLNNSHENKNFSAKKTITKRNKSFNYNNNNKNLSRNEGNIYTKNNISKINNIKTNNKDKTNNEKLNLKKINYKFNDILHIDINKEIKTKKKMSIQNKNKKIENKTNRLINLKLGLYTFNTNTKREEEKYKKGINKILTNYNTKRDNKNFNISLIKKHGFSSNPKSKKKNVDIFIDKNDLIEEAKTHKKKLKNNSYHKKIVKQKNNFGVLGSLINSNDMSLKDDLKKKKTRITYSKPKSKDKKFNNNINIVLSLNDDYLNIKKDMNNNKKTNEIKNILNLNRNNSCKNSELQKNNKMKRLNYNFSSSNIKKKKIHLISQIRPKLYINKPDQLNSKNKNNKS